MLAVSQHPAYAAHYADNFDRTNSTTSAGPDWTNMYNNVGIANNRAYSPNDGTVGGYGVARWNTPMLTNNHRVQAQFYGAALNSAMSLIMGANITSTIRFVSLDVFAPAPYDTWYASISTYDNWDISTALSTETNDALAGVTNGDTFSIERTGNLFTIKQNGTTINTWADTVPAIPRDASHRYVGMSPWSTDQTGGMRIENFQADDI